MVYVKYDTKDQNTTRGIPVVTTWRSAEEVVGSEKETVTKKKSETLPEDVYSLIVAAPVFSAEFFLGLYVIFLKYIVFGLLLSGIRKSEEFLSEPKLHVVKFLLIPVAVAMQEDLIYVFASLANLTIGADAQELSKSATKSRYALSLILRIIDGSLSLSANFAVMLVTPGVLNVFLNFAALHFLQGIDDSFFAIATMGFFGDNIESNVKKYKGIPLKKRKKKRVIEEFDTILFLATLASCTAIFGYVVNLQAKRSL
mmetsp:Transcript_5195/g.15132  ORF Transcript_5195/g.15132 Transcript_5195/m.15132 type:complete len:256 (+) Transcript_5195:168-935(+)